jgi:hypothetical protein
MTETTAFYEHDRWVRYEIVSSELVTSWNPETKQEIRYTAGGVVAEKSEGQRRREK